MTEYAMEWDGMAGAPPVRVRRGEVYAVLAESGEAADRLTAALTGKKAGESARFFGRAFSSPREALRRGVAIVPRAGCLAPGFTVLDQARLIPGVPWKRKKARAAAEEMAKEYGFSVSLSEKAGSLPGGERFRAELLRTLLWNAEAAVFSFPEERLTPYEMEEMGAVMKKMAREGKTVVLITASPFAARLCHGYADLRGREKDESAFSPAIRELAPGGVALEARDLTAAEGRDCGLRSVSLEARTGEITAVLGAAGSGLHTLADALAGCAPLLRGRLRLNGKDVSRCSVGERMRAGLRYAPGPALNFGMPFSGRAVYGMTLRRLRDKTFQESGFVKWGNVRRFGEEALQNGRALPEGGAFAPMESLTGYEKQRCCLAREIDGNADVLLALRPTDGMTPGEARDIWARLLSFRDSRRAVLLFTRDAREAMAVAGRILVLCRGEITGEFDPALTTEKELSLFMAGTLRQDREEPYDEE